MLPATALLDDNAVKAGFIQNPNTTTAATEFLNACGVSDYSLVTYDASIAPQTLDIIQNIKNAGRPKTNTLAELLQINEHCVIKTLLFHNPKTKEPYCILMHGDCRVNSRAVAKHYKVRQITSLAPDAANELSGYIVGGTSAFGLKTPMPVIIPPSILQLESIIINGGGQSKYLVMSPQCILEAFSSDYAKSLGFSYLVMDCGKAREYDVAHPIGGDQQEEHLTSQPVDGAHSATPCIDQPTRPVVSTLGALYNELCALRYTYHQNNIDFPQLSPGCASYELVIEPQLEASELLGYAPEEIQSKQLPNTVIDRLDRDYTVHILINSSIMVASAPSPSNCDGNLSHPQPTGSQQQKQRAQSTSQGEVVPVQCRASIHLPKGYPFLPCHPSVQPVNHSSFQSEVKVLEFLDYLSTIAKAGALSALPSSSLSSTTTTALPSDGSGMISTIIHTIVADLIQFSRAYTPPVSREEQHTAKSAPSHDPKSQQYTTALGITSASMFSPEFTRQIIPSQSLKKAPRRAGVPTTIFTFNSQTQIITPQFKIDLKNISPDDMYDIAHSSLIDSIPNLTKYGGHFMQPSSHLQAVRFCDGEMPQIIQKEHGNIRIGFVGLPNVGKSSLYNLLSTKKIPAQNFCFCTINPNTCQVPIIDQRFLNLVKNHQLQTRGASSQTSSHDHPHPHTSTPSTSIGQPIVHPAALTAVDIAGIVQGACKGKGLGNSFLHHISTVQVIFQVVRCFFDQHIDHIETSVNPIRDIHIVNRELYEKDLEQMTKRIYRSAPRLIALPLVHQAEEPALRILLKAHDWLLSTEKPLRYCKWTQPERDYLAQLQSWTSKPMCFLLNMSIPQYAQPDVRSEIVRLIHDEVYPHYPDCQYIPICTVYEQAAALLKDFLHSNRQSYRIHQTAIHAILDARGIGRSADESMLISAIGRELQIYEHGKEAILYSTKDGKQSDAEQHDNKEKHDKQKKDKSHHKKDKKDKKDKKPGSSTSGKKKASSSHTFGSSLLDLDGDSSSFTAFLGDDYSASKEEHKPKHSSKKSSKKTPTTGAKESTITPSEMALNEQTRHRPSSSSSVPENGMSHTDQKQPTNAGTQENDVAGTGTTNPPSPPQQPTIVTALESLGKPNHVFWQEVDLFTQEHHLDNVLPVLIEFHEQSLYGGGGANTSSEDPVAEDNQNLALHNRSTAEQNKSTEDRLDEELFETPSHQKNDESGAGNHDDSNEASTQTDLNTWISSKSSQVLLMDDPQNPLSRMINVSCNLSRIIQFFIWNSRLVRGVMIPGETTAVNASRRVDHNIAETLSSCDIIRYNDLEACRFQLSRVREAGLLRLEGKNTIINDGDIVTFRTKK